MKLRRLSLLWVNLWQDGFGGIYSLSRKLARSPLSFLAFLGCLLLPPSSFSLGTAPPRVFGPYLCATCSDIGAIDPTSGPRQALPSGDFGGMLAFIKARTITNGYRQGDLIIVCNGTLCQTIQFLGQQFVPISRAVRDSGVYKNAPSPAASGDNSTPIFEFAPHENPAYSAYAPPPPSGFVADTVVISGSGHITWTEQVNPDGTVTVTSVTLVYTSFTVQVGITQADGSVVDANGQTIVPPPSDGSGCSYERGGDCSNPVQQ
jgi:hypothetical protein